MQIILSIVKVIRAFVFNFSEQAAFVCLMMRQRSENVLEFTLGNYFLDQLLYNLIIINNYSIFIIVNASRTST